MVKVGATPLLHLTEAGHVGIRPVASWNKYNSKAHLVPVAAGFENVKVVASVNVCLNTLFVARLRVVALLVDDTVATVSNNAALAAAATAEAAAFVACVDAVVADVEALPAWVVAVLAEVEAEDAEVEARPAWVVAVLADVEAAAAESLAASTNWSKSTISTHLTAARSVANTPDVCAIAHL